MRRVLSPIARAAVLVCGLILSTEALAEPPSVKLVTAPVMSPDAAITYYNTLASLMSHTNGAAAWTARPPEIQELARSLGGAQYSKSSYSFVVNEYIRNNIATEFRFGLSKGARGALIDQSGTPFDQAHLMVELLRQGAVLKGYTTNVSYAIGKLNLTGAQFQAWTSFSDAAAACQYLADGGIPVAINAPSGCPTTPGIAITTVSILHVWVLADGVLYDPSYKIVTHKAGIDLASAMGCKTGGVTSCGSSLLTTAMVPAATQNCSVPGVSCVRNVNQAGIEGQLTTYATTLQQYIQNYNATNEVSLALEDVVGGSIIDTTQVPMTGSLIPDSAYGPVSFSSTTDLYDPFRTKLTVQYDQINQLLYADEIAGNRLRIWGYADPGTAPTTHLTLYSEYRPLAGGALANHTQTLETVLLTVQHPYAANSGGYAAETTANQVVNIFNECFFGTVGCISTDWHVGVITIVHGFGEQGVSTATHYADLQRRDKFNAIPVEDPTNPLHVSLHTTNRNKGTGLCVGVLRAPAAAQVPTDWNICYEQQDATVAATWLAQTSKSRAIAAAINVANVQTHHTLGIVFSSDFGTANSSNLNVQTMLSANSMTGAASDRTATFMSIAALSNRLEGGIFEQSSGAFDGGSAISGIVLSNATLLPDGTHVPFLDVNSANAASVRAYLENNSSLNWSSLLTPTITDYASASPQSYNLIVPLYGTAGTFQLPNAGVNINGTGIAAFGTGNDRVAYLSTLYPIMVKGSSAPPTFDPVTEAEQLVKVNDYASKSRKSATVDLTVGDLALIPKPDLVTGVGRFPNSLSYQRVYSASSIGFTDLDIDRQHYNIPTELDSASIGGGWTHALAIKSQIASDAYAGMGRDSAVAASRVIAGVFAQRWLSLGTVDIRSRLANIFAAHWLINGLNQNTIVVTRPPARQIFSLLPDGTYDAGPGHAEVLTRNAAPTLDGWSGSWVWNGIGVIFTLTDKDGSVLTFEQQLPVGTNHPTGGYNYPFSWLYLPETWEFPSGVVVSFSYAGTGWEAALYQGACLTGVSNNLGRSLTFNDPCAGNPEGTVTTPAGAQWVMDDAGRQIHFTSNHTFVNSFTRTSIPTDLYVQALDPSGVDLGTTHYNYVVPVSAITPDRANIGITKWYTPGDTSNPYLTFNYDSLFRVVSVTDNSLVNFNGVPSHYTTNYLIDGLYGIENQKRAAVIDPSAPGATAAALTTTYFDRWGDRSQLIDPLSRVTSWSYDSHHRMTSASHPEGNSESYSYDARSNLLSETRYPKRPGFAPLTTSTIYGEGPISASCTNSVTCNLPVSITDTLQNSTTYSYLSAGTGRYLTTGTGQLQRVVGPSVSTQTGGVAGQAQTDYCYGGTSGTAGTVSLLSGTIGKVDAGTNRVISYNYGDVSIHLALLSKTANPLQALVPPATAGGLCASAPKSNAFPPLVTGFTFDQGLATGPGNLTQIVDPNRNSTNYAYDAMRRLTTKSAPLNSLTRYCYDADGQLLSTNRGTTSSSADPFAAHAMTDGQCPGVFDPNLWQSEYRAYFPTGDLRTIQDANGNVTTYAYDPVGRQQIVQDGDGRQSATVYDLAGQTISLWRGGSNWIDASTGAPVTGNIPSTWDPSLYVGVGPLRYGAYTYSQNGLRQSETDSDGNSTGSIYDGFDRLSSTIYADSKHDDLWYTSDGTSATASCSASGQPCRKISRSGNFVTYAYDQMDRKVTRTPLVEGGYTYGYDLLGEPTATYKLASGGTPGHSTLFGYDPAGRTTSETDDGLLVGNSFDANGNRVQLTWPDNYFVTYQYDALNRMTYALENGSAELAYYHYDSLSRRDYTCLGGQSSVCPASATNKVSYAYEPDGDLKSISQLMNTSSVTLSYVHNHSHQITSLSSTDAFYLPVPATAPTGYAPTLVNQYSTVGSNKMLYDDNGNLSTLFPSGGAQAFTYDSENRLIKAAVGGGGTSNIFYDYDALERRTTKTVGGTGLGVGGTTTNFLSDGQEEIAELGPSGGVLRRYIPGSFTDERIAVIEGVGASAIRTFFHVNHQGSVMAMTDATGNAIAAIGGSPGCAIGVNCQRLAYDEYGGITSGTASTGEAYRFTGRRFDPETGLYYYRARYYSPSIGRFMQMDPIGNEDDLNLYSYVRNDPLSRTDPSGKSSCVPDGPGRISCSYDGRLDHLVLQVWAWFNDWAPVANSEIELPSGDSWDNAAPTDKPEGGQGQSSSQEQGTSDEAKPSLLDPRASQHVLDGEPNAGGGHRSGTGRSGKSEFPSHWSDEKIEGEISDIVTDPQTQWSKPDSRGYISGSGTRDGVDIKVVYDTRTGRIVTGYPTNTPRNP